MQSAVRSVQLLLLLLVGYSSGRVADICGSPGWTVPALPSGWTLKQVTAVIRHGDRTVWNGSRCWSGDDALWSCHLSQLETPKEWTGQLQDNGVGGAQPRLFEKVYMSSDEVLNGNCSVAQLTSIGYHQHMANGRSLRSAYVDSGFMNGSLVMDEIYLRSDDIPRTLQSAESLILGMFPSSTYKGSTHSKMDTPPLTIPIHTRDSQFDYMTVNPFLCPKAGQYEIEFRKSKTWTDHHVQTKGLFEKINKSLGIELDEDSFDHFADCICTHYCHNMSLPKGISDDLINDVWAEDSWQFYSMYKYPSVEDNAKTGIGFLLKDIWKNLNDTVYGRDKVKKFIVFSGHDTTIMPILVALRVDTGAWPAYASMILIELYTSTAVTAADNPTWMVRFLYNGEVLYPSFCDDHGLCDYGKLSSYLETVTPPDNYKDSICTVSS